jgi:hypothetical protein
VAERRRRRDEEAHAVDACDEVGDRPGAVDDVLGVVEDDEGRRGAERLRDLVGQPLRGDVGQADAGRHLRGHLVDRFDRDQRDPRDATAERRCNGSRGLPGEARLSRAAGPGQRDDPGARIRQGSDERGEVGVSADQRIGRRPRRRGRKGRRGVLDQGRFRQNGW